MTRLTYAPKQTYVGTGSVSAYNFAFKITALAQLEIIELNDSDVETQRVRGTDVTYLSSVTFDPIDGGGTVNLTANLTANYTLIILLADDAPTQLHEFKDKGSFTLQRIESALDHVVGAVQRLTYRGKQALRIHDSDNELTLDTQFGTTIADAAGRYLKVNDTTPDGFEYGKTKEEMLTYITPPGTVDKQVFTWNHGTSVWEAKLQGGGLYASATQDITAGGKITVNAAVQQLLKVRGHTTSQTANIAPFSGTIQNGLIITLLGMSNTQVLKIPYSDTVGGCLLKGDCYLGLNDTLTLCWDSGLNRYIEISRN